MVLAEIQKEMIKYTKTARVPIITTLRARLAIAIFHKSEFIDYHLSKYKKLENLLIEKSKELGYGSEDQNIGRFHKWFQEDGYALIKKCNAHAESIIFQISACLDIIAKLLFNKSNKKYMFSKFWNIEGSDCKFVKTFGIDTKQIIEAHNRKWINQHKLYGGWGFKEIRNLISHTSIVAFTSSFSSTGLHNPSPRVMKIADKQYDKWGEYLEDINKNYKVFMKDIFALPQLVDVSNSFKSNIDILFNRSVI